MANVKTAPALIEEDYDRATMQRLGGDLPHVFQQRSGQYSYWMFRARGVCIRLKGELGSEEFFQHWHELYQLFGLDARRPPKQQERNDGGRRVHSILRDA